MLTARGARAGSRRRSGGTVSPAFRTSARGNHLETGNPGTSPIVVPNSVSAGDVLLVVSTQNTGAQTHSISGGGTGVSWSTDRGPDTSSGNNMRSYVWTADAVASSAGSTITVTSTGGGRFPTLLLVLTGVTRTGRVYTGTYVNTASKSHPFPAVTVPGSGWLLIGVSSMRVATAPPAGSFVGGAPSGATLRDESYTAAPTSPNMTVSGIVANALVNSGARTPGTATSTKNATSIAYTFAFAPA